MNQINLLRQALKPHLKWHGARLRDYLVFYTVTVIQILPDNQFFK